MSGGQLGWTNYSGGNGDGKKWMNLRNGRQNKWKGKGENQYDPQVSGLSNWVKGGLLHGSTHIHI